MAKQNRNRIPAQQNNIPERSNTANPPPELIEQFLGIQQQELKLRTEELALHSQQAQNNKSIAEASISANLQDRESSRSHSARIAKIALIGVTVIIAIIVLFAAFAISSGKAELVMKMLEIVSIFVAGFIGGYGFKSSNHSKTDPNITG